MEIEPKFVPTCICGDGCPVNIKGSRFLETKFGIKSPFSRCSSHAAAGTIRCLCTSETMSQTDARVLYENLRALLKHFGNSPKSSEMLIKSLHLLEMHDIHLLNWGSTRWAGFLDGCIQASGILVAFLDIIIAGNIQPEE